MLTSPARQRSASGVKAAGPCRTTRMPSKRPVIRPASQPIVSTGNRACTDPPTQRYRAAADERPPVGEHRPVGNQGQDEVVRLLAAREVLAAVDEDLVCTERPHEVELAGV